jgi:hypothetical protein
MDERDITNNEENDESCYIVETKTEVIEIDETCDDLEVTENEIKDTSNDKLNIQNESMGDYQVIDETGCTSNPENIVTENDYTNSNSEDPVSH